jgi:hypothetical protein
MTKDEALRLALEALEDLGNHDRICPQWPTYAEPENYPKCNCGYDQAINGIKAALEAKNEPVVWGASSISKPEYIAEQKAKTKELRNMTDEVVQTVPNFDQLQQIVNNLERCLTRDSKHEFLRVWIRDWTEHKLSKHTSAALEAKDEPVAWYVERQHEGFRDHGLKYGPFWKRDDALEWCDDNHFLKNLYTTPPQRTWVGLTDEEKFEVSDISDSFEDVVDAVEAKLKEKNT